MPAMPQQPKSGKSFWKWILIGLGVVLLIVILFFALRPSSSTSGGSGATTTTSPPSLIAGPLSIPPRVLPGLGGSSGSMLPLPLPLGGGGSILPSAPGGILNPINLLNPIGALGSLGGLFGR